MTHLTRGSSPTRFPAAIFKAARQERTDLLSPPISMPRVSDVLAPRQKLPVSPVGRWVSQVPQGWEHLDGAPSRAVQAGTGGSCRTYRRTIPGTRPSHAGGHMSHAWADIGVWERRVGVNRIVGGRRWPDDLPHSTPIPVEPVQWGCRSRYYRPSGRYVVVRRVHCAFRRLIRLSSRSATRGLSFLARTDHGAHASEAVKQESYQDRVRAPLPAYRTVLLGAGCADDSRSPRHDGPQPHRSHSAGLI